jgi:DNA-binding CsgD family transcriptional regulator
MRINNPGDTGNRNAIAPASMCEKRIARNSPSKVRIMPALAAASHFHDKSVTNGESARVDCIATTDVNEIESEHRARRSCLSFIETCITPFFKRKYVVVYKCTRTKADHRMRVGFAENLAPGLDIAAPSRRCVVVTTRPSSPNQDVALLTEGQRDCLRLVYNHMTSKDIARILQVSPHTVDMRLRTAMKTLSVGSRIEAARLLVQEEAGGEVLPDAYQPLIYHPPEIAGGGDSATLVSPASSEGFGSAHEPGLRFSPDVDPTAYGPPRASAASITFETAHPSSWAGTADGNADDSTRSLAGSRPWGRRNDLSIPARLGWIFGIAVGSALAFGSVLGALAALKTLF